MQLRWTEAAATDLERIADYLFSHAPERAPRLVRSIYEAPETLLSFPHRGRGRRLAVFAKHVVHPERSAKNGVSTQPFPAEESPG